MQNKSLREYKYNTELKWLVRVEYIKLAESMNLKFTWKHCNFDVIFPLRVLVDYMIDSEIIAVGGPR